MYNVPVFGHSYSFEQADETYQNLNGKKKKPNIGKHHRGNNKSVLQEHMCEECKRKFNSFYLLDLHLEEAHSPFFQVALSKNTPDLYKCLESSCSFTFNEPKERKIHYRETHHISGEEEPPYYLHNRKRKQRQAQHKKSQKTSMDIE